VYRIVIRDDLDVVSLGVFDLREKLRFQSAASSEYRPPRLPLFQHVDVEVPSAAARLNHSPGGSQSS